MRFRWVSVNPVEGNTVSVERVINAPASDIFALVADTGKHPRFDGSGTVKVNNSAAGAVHLVLDVNGFFQ